MSQLNAATDLVNLGGPEGSFGRPRARAVVLFGILFLFFFQMLSDFVAGLYGLGLRHTSIPPEIASLGLFLSPLLLGLFRRGSGSDDLAQSSATAQAPRGLPRRGPAEHAVDGDRPGRDGERIPDKFG